jgi:hypothetical protein
MKRRSLLAWTRTRQFREAADRLCFLIAQAQRTKSPRLQARIEAEIEQVRAKLETLRSSK